MEHVTEIEDFERYYEHLEVKLFTRIAQGISLEVLSKFQRVERKVDRILHVKKLD